MILANPTNQLAVFAATAREYKYRRLTPLPHSFIELSSCLDVEKEEKDSERVALSVIAKSCVITSKVSPSPLSAVWRVVVVSSVFLA